MPTFTNKQQGFFSNNSGTTTNQAFFDAAFAARVHADPVFKEAYNCNLTQMCNTSTWLDQYMGYDTSCYTKYSLIESNTPYEMVKIKTTTTVAVNPTATAVPIHNDSHFVGGASILPQIGNTVVNTNGVLMEVTALSLATNNSTMSLRIRDTGAVAQVLTAGDELIVLSGSFLADCACPVGQFSFRDLPIIHNLNMINPADKGDLCGDALVACQYLKIPFTDENGNVYEKWYTQALQDMYRRFEKKKHYERLLNPNFGIIPVLKARGLNFSTASSTAITLADVISWKTALNEAGISCKEFAVFAGGSRYQQWQSLLLELGGSVQQNVVNPTGGCKWIDMEYCGLHIGGLTLHIYEDCSFTNGKELGKGFGNTQIFVPLCNRRITSRTMPVDGVSGNSGDLKMFTTVYFRDMMGRVYDNYTDSNGILGPRNTFGAGCKKHEWTIESRFTQEVHCPNSWGFTSLP